MHLLHRPYENDASKNSIAVSDYHEFLQIIVKELNNYKAGVNKG